MKNAWNRIWKICLALAAPGIVLLLIGLQLGGFRPVSWGSHGAQVLSLHDVHIDEPSLQPFNAVAIDVRTMNVTIVVSDHFGLQVDATQIYRDVTWENTGGTLHLTEKSPGGVITFGWNDMRRGQATISLPAGVTLGQVTVSSTTGGITVAAPAKTIRLDSTTGDIGLTGPADDATLGSTTGDIRVDAITGRLETHTTTGDINITGPGGDISAETTTGDITVTGDARTITLAATTGRVQVSQTTPWDAATYTLATTTGQIVCNGDGAPQVIGKHAKAATGQAVADEALRLSISTTTGDIAVTLGS